MSRQTHFDIAGRIQGETEKAYRFSDDDENWVWLPKSQVEVEKQPDGTVIVTAPEWLLEEKGLI